MEQVAADKIEAGPERRRRIEKEEKIASVRAAECAEDQGVCRERSGRSAACPRRCEVPSSRTSKLSDLSWRQPKYSKSTARWRQTLTMEAVCVLKNVPPNG